MSEEKLLIKEILSREEGDVNAYLSAVLRVRGELPIKDGKIQCVRADSAFCDVIIDFINKARSIVKDSPVETGREGSGEAARFFFKMEGGGMDALLRAAKLGAYACETNPFLNEEKSLRSRLRPPRSAGRTACSTRATVRRYATRSRLWTRATARWRRTTCS